VAGTVIGLLHPGEMGAAVGGCLVVSGYPVLWASAGRSPATAARAEAAGLRDAGTIAALSQEADTILSICPPHAAVDVARGVAAGGQAAGGQAGEAGFRGVFVDANAVSPATAREVCAIVEAGGAGYVDGGIIGPPPGQPGSAAGSTHLYLSGSRAAQVRDLFRGTALDARAIDGGVGAASAVKMAYAAWTKGTAALILAVRALARAEGVEDILLAEWRESQPGLADRSRSAASSAAAKGWRWDGEMEEIAASMAAAGLPSGFHQAAAEIFRRSPRKQ
jgi:3-hydroxyisobutyrate dehydrogenase-like beta-hydroxyacid dehydrogenase